MGKILCSTRGGKESYRTQDAAISLAKERSDTLIFLYVANASFLNKTAAPIVVDPVNEITKMGEFLLLMAKERAAEHGVEAETVVRRENMADNLKDVADCDNASLIIFGRPSGEEGSVFELDDLKALAGNIENETGIETRII